ncbi:MAG: 4-hydroxybenzoate octaprenyltransferase [Brachymonas sp.]|nr:4-hydroxybenzoate octaprenyltransferase [Brachymonas sp.]
MSAARTPPHRPPCSSFLPRLRLYLDLIRWDRPAGWLLLLWPTLAALWLAAGGFPGWHLLAVFTLGTILMRSAGCCINDVADREFDRHVKRTAKRPVTSGRISVKEALAVGAALAFVAFLLVLSTNRITVLYAVPALLISVAYPYAKRFVSIPQAVLGLAFSWGIPMAYAAVQARVPAQALWLLLGNLFWVLAYDTEYAMVDRDDDLRIGIKTSAIAFGRWDVAAVAICYALYVGIWWGLLWLAAPPSPWGRAAWTAGLLAVLAQVAWHLWLIHKRERAACFTAFKHNHWIGLAALLTTIAITIARHAPAN